MDLYDVYSCRFAVIACLKLRLARSPALEGHHRLEPGKAKQECAHGSFGLMPHEPPSVRCASKLAVTVRSRISQVRNRSAHSSNSFWFLEVNRQMLQEARDLVGWRASCNSLVAVGKKQYQGKVTGSPVRHRDSLRKVQSQLLLRPRR